MSGILNLLLGIRHYSIINQTICFLSFGQKMTPKNLVPSVKNQELWKFSQMQIHLELAVSIVNASGYRHAIFSYRGNKLNRYLLYSFV